MCQQLFKVVSCFPVSWWKGLFGSPHKWFAACQSYGSAMVSNLAMKKFEQIIKSFFMESVFGADDCHHYQRL
jgi:hypothetical protein